MNTSSEAAVTNTSSGTITTPDGFVLDPAQYYKGLAKLDADHLQLPADATNHSIVYDPLTGLMEAVNAPGFLPSDGGDYPDALIERAESLDFAGYKDWMIPAVKQGVHSVDYSRRGPAADISLYPDAVNDWYLCQQTQWTLGDTGSSRSFWYVYMYLGNVNNYHANYRFRARPVRVASPAGQCLVLGQ